MTSTLKRVGKAPVRLVRGTFSMFSEFVRTEVAGSVLLLLATIVALAAANSPLREAYLHFWETEIVLEVAGFEFHQTIHHLINDGLMALFFFVVGLEIKRELIAGQLSSLRKAMLPLFAAVGGMVIPALIFALVLRGGTGASGWGVPMATDIAFVLGVLALLGDRIPTSLKVFVTALAIVDDIGAVLVIALFYTEQISLLALGISALFFAALVLMNRLGVRDARVYAALGLAMWFAFLETGIHATLAGVLVALTIPTYSKISVLEFVKKGRTMIDEIEQGEDKPAIENQKLQKLAGKLRSSVQDLESPLLELEHDLHPVSSFIIMPLFALANAGITLDESLLQTVMRPVGIGVVLGLIVGKQVGITAATWLATKLGVASLPEGVRWRQIYGASWLAAIGFTMALFIASLAFTDAALLTSAKSGILVASVIAGVVGGLILLTSGEPGDASQDEDEALLPDAPSA